MKQARFALICALGLLGLFGAAARAVAAPADLDRSFGDWGIASVVDPSAESVGLESAARMAIGPKDEIFVLYSNYGACEPPSQECQIDLSLVRFNARGGRDTSFGQGGAAHVTVHQNPYQHSFDLAVGRDRRPVVVADDLGPALIVRFDRGGQPDASFGVGGRALWSTQTVAPSPPVIAVQGDGSVVVARERGSFSPGRSELAVARFTPGGELDTGFGVGGESTVALATRSRPAGLLLSPSGRISSAAPQCCGGQPLFGEGFSVARLLADGTPDSGLDGDGTLLYPTPGAQATVEAAALTRGEGMVVIFEVEGSSSATVGNVVKLRSDGQVDRSFGSAGSVRLFNRIGMTDPSGVTVDPQGRLVGVGWDGNVSLFRLRADGGADRTFNGGQHVSISIKAAQEGAAGVGTQSDGGIVALAESTCCQPKAYDLIRLRGGGSRIRCLGRRATIVGTRNADELQGTPRRDVIAALGGRDKVRGLGGADLICGGPGKDSLGGGPGRDRVRQ
jgi:uncharacterized delta-60 repeat protein